MEITIWLLFSGFCLKRKETLAENQAYFVFWQPKWIFDKNPKTFHLNFYFHHNYSQEQNQPTPNRSFSTVFN